MIPKVEKFQTALMTGLRQNTGTKQSIQCLRENILPLPTPSAVMGLFHTHP
jgi:hypothetical protein